MHLVLKQNSLLRPGKQVVDHHQRDGLMKWKFTKLQYNYVNKRDFYFGTNYRLLVFADHSLGLFLITQCHSGRSYFCKVN